MRTHKPSDRYMQGGAYVLSRRAALVVAGCTLGPWRDCPPTVFSDSSNPAANAAIQAKCNAPQTNAEDLYVGVCVKDANLTLLANACMRTMQGATQHKKESYSDSPTTQVVSRGFKSVSAKDEHRMLHRLSEMHKCRCPLSLHPVKGPTLLQATREFFRSRGCWGAEGAIRRTSQPNLGSLSGRAFPGRLSLRMAGKLSPRITRTEGGAPGPPRRHIAAADLLSRSKMPCMPRMDKSRKSLPSSMCLVAGELEGSSGTLKRATAKVQRDGVNTLEGCYEACHLNSRCGWFTFKAKTELVEPVSGGPPENRTTVTCRLKTAWGAGKLQPCSKSSRCSSGQVRMSSGEEKALADMAARSSLANVNTSRGLLPRTQSSMPRVEPGMLLAANAEHVAAGVSMSVTSVSAAIAGVPTTHGFPSGGGGSGVGGVGVGGIGVGGVGGGGGGGSGGGGAGGGGGDGGGENALAQSHLQTLQHATLPSAPQLLGEEVFIKAFASKVTRGKVKELHRLGRTRLHATQASTTKGTIWMLMDGVRFFGDTLIKLSRETQGKVGTIDQCSRACEQAKTAGCIKFTFFEMKGTNEKRCYLKATLARNRWVALLTHEQVELPHHRDGSLMLCTPRDVQYAKCVSGVLLLPEHFASPNAGTHLAPADLTAATAELKEASAAPKRAGSSADMPDVIGDSQSPKRVEEGRPKEREDISTNGAERLQRMQYPRDQILMSHIVSRIFLSEAVRARVMGLLQQGHARWHQAKSVKVKGWLLMSGVQFVGDTLSSLSRATLGWVTSTRECSQACEEARGSGCVKFSFKLMHSKPYCFLKKAAMCGAAYCGGRRSLVLCSDGDHKCESGVLVLPEHVTENFTADVDVSMAATGQPATPSSPVPL